MNGVTFDNQTLHEKANAAPTAGVGQLAYRGGVSPVTEPTLATGRARDHYVFNSCSRTYHLGCKAI